LKGLRGTISTPTIQELTNLSDGIFFDLEVDATDVDPAHEHNRLMTLNRSSLELLMGDGLFDKHLNMLKRLKSFVSIICSVLYLSVATVREEQCKEI